MDFDKISFRPSPEEQQYFERLNQRYRALTVTEFFRMFLADCMRWRVGNIDPYGPDSNEPNYAGNVNMLSRNEAQRYQYPEPDYQTQMIIVQQALQIRQMQEALMQMSFQLQSMRQQQYQQQYMYYPPFNGGWAGNQFSFQPFPVYAPRQPVEQEPFDPLTVFTNSAEKALRFKNALKALWP